MNEEEILVCDDCGTDVEVVETICPYDLEINLTESPMNLCDDCYGLRCDEI